MRGDMRAFLLCTLLCNILADPTDPTLVEDGRYPDESPPEITQADLQEASEAVADKSCDATQQLPDGWFKRWDKRTGAPSSRQHIVSEARPPL